MPISSNLRMSSSCRCVGGHQRPGARDARLADVQEAGADRRVRPLVQADAVIVAIEVGDLEGEVAEGVRAVHDHGDVARVRHLADALDREDLAGAVGDVADQDQFRLGRDRLLEALVQIVHAEGGGTGNEIVLRTMPSRRSRWRKVVEHARIVLIGGQDLVAGLQVDAVLRVLQRLAGVARDGHLFGIAAGGGGEMPAHAFDAALQDVDHGVVRPHVAVIEVAPHGLLHGARRRADVAVVQIQDVAVDGEGSCGFRSRSPRPGRRLAECVPRRRWRRRGRARSHCPGTRPRRPPIGRNSVDSSGQHPTMADPGQGCFGSLSVANNVSCPVEFTRDLSALARGG